MAHIVGVDIPHEECVVTLLAYVYDIDVSTAQKVLEEANVSTDACVKGLTDDELGRICEAVGGYRIEGDLRRKANLNIKRSAETSSYRDIRHRRGLPVRGQKMKNNARTREGPVGTVASKKK